METPWRTLPSNKTCGQDVRGATSVVCIALCGSYSDTLAPFFPLRATPCTMPYSKRHLYPFRLISAPQLATGCAEPTAWHALARGDCAVGLHAHDPSVAVRECRLRADIQCTRPAEHVRGRRPADTTGWIRPEGTVAGHKGRACTKEERAKRADVAQPALRSPLKLPTSPPKHLPKSSVANEP